MENEEKLQLTTKKRIGTCDTECTLNLSKENDIKKILTLRATPIVRNVMCDNGNVKFDGIIEYDILIATSTDEILPLRSQSTFNQSYETSINSQDCQPFILAQMQDVRVSTHDADFIINTSVSFDIYILDSSTTMPLATPDEDVLVKEGEIQSMRHTCTSTHDFTHSITLDRDSRVHRIAFTSVTPCIKAVSSGNDSFVASVDLHLNCIYFTEDGIMKNLYKEYNIQQNVSAEGVDETSILQSMISSGEVQLTESEDSFILDVPLTITTHIYRNEVHQCILDAYSLKREVKLTTSSFEQDIFLSTSSSEESILTTIETSPNMPVIDKLLTAVPTNIRIVNQQVKNSEVLLEGVASFNVIYFSEDDDGSNVLNSLDIDIPYSNTFSVKDVKDGDMVVTSLIVKDASIKSKHHKELEILANLHATFNVSRTTLQALTSSISYGDDKSPEDYAMEIYLAKDGDTMWEVGKKLNISPADLTMQNPSLTLPLKNGDKLVAFHRKNI